MVTSNRKRRGFILKRSLSLLLAMVLILNVNMTQVFAAGEAPTERGTYTVPIESLVSAAPLPAVQSAFAGAFGDNAVITVDESGNMVATIRAQHMIINFGGEYHANVMTIEGATYHSYKQELSSTTFGDPSAIVEIDVPDEVSFPLSSPNASGSYVLTLTVDFMDSFMGGGNPYSTNVTLTLDFDNATGDTTGLNNLVAALRALNEGNYTADTWLALQTLLAQAETMVADGGTIADINDMIAQLNTAKDNLQWQGSSYSKVEEALAKVPADSSVYTQESWDALMAAANAVEQGLAADRQGEVDAWAVNIEEKIAVLVYKDGDYTEVDKAVASVAGDLSKYTDESISVLQNALDSVVSGLKANEQARINKMAEDIHAAVKGLVEKETDENKDGSLDKNNLSNGIYNVSVRLWHATNDSPSMAASSFENNARLVVKDGVSTLYIYTKSMTFGSITASLQEMKVADLNGNYVMAKVENKDGSGNPTSFSFALPHTEEYIQVQVNPHVEMMGNQFIDARIKVDYASLEKVSDDLEDPAIDVKVSGTDTTGTATTGTGNTTTTTTTATTSTENGKNTLPKTGDNTNILAYSLMALASSGIIVSLLVGKKRGENGYE